MRINICSCDRCPRSPCLHTCDHGPCPQYLKAVLPLYGESICSGLEHFLRCWFNNKTEFAEVGWWSDQQYGHSQFVELLKSRPFNSRQQRNYFTILLIVHSSIILTRPSRALWALEGPFCDSGATVAKRGTKKSDSMNHGADGSLYIYCKKKEMRDKQLLYLQEDLIQKLM